MGVGAAAQPATSGLHLGAGVPGIGIAVPTFERSEVEDGAQHPRVDDAEGLQRPLHVVRAGLAVPHHDNRAVGPGRRDRAIGDRQERRGVDDDEVVQAPGLHEQLDHRFTAQQLRGVGRNRPARHEMQAVDLPLLDHVVELQLVCQHVGQTDRAHQLEPVGKDRTAQISLDQQDSLPRLGECDREVGGNARLSFCGEGRRDREHADRLLDIDELKVGPQLPEGLGAGPVLVALGKQRRLLRRPAGICPRTGAPRRSRRSSGVRTVRSRRALSRAAVTPSASPSRKPAAIHRSVCGPTGVGSRVGPLTRLRRTEACPDSLSMSWTRRGI